MFSKIFNKKTQKEQEGISVECQPLAYRQSRRQSVKCTCSTDRQTRLKTLPSPHR